MSIGKNNMKPDHGWIEDWRVGVNPNREREVSDGFISIFADFWKTQSMDDKAKTTRNRYAAALHSIGGYLVEQAISAEGKNKTYYELVSECIGPDDGPLIHFDNETWQNEIDTVSRKLYKYMRNKAE